MLIKATLRTSFLAVVVLVILTPRADASPKVVGNRKDSDDADGTVAVLNIQDHNKTQYLNQNFDGGNYNYGYDIKPSGPLGQFHHENKAVDEVVYGCYGYLDPNEEDQITFYISDAWGYRPVKQEQPVEIFYPADNPEGTGHHNGKLTPWADIVFPEKCIYFAKEIAAAVPKKASTASSRRPIGVSYSSTLQQSPHTTTPLLPFTSSPALKQQSTHTSSSPPFTPSSPTVRGGGSGGAPTTTNPFAGGDRRRPNSFLNPGFKSITNTPTALASEAIGSNSGGIDGSPGPGRSGINGGNGAPAGPGGAGGPGGSGGSSSVGPAGHGGAGGLGGGGGRSQDGPGGNAGPGGSGGSGGSGGGQAPGGHGGSGGGGGFGGHGFVGGSAGPGGSGGSGGSGGLGGHGGHGGFGGSGGDGTDGAGGSGGSGGSGGPGGSGSSGAAGSGGSGGAGGLGGSNGPFGGGGGGARPSYSTGASYTPQHDTTPPARSTPSRPSPVVSTQSRPPAVDPAYASYDEGSTVGITPDAPQPPAPSASLQRQPPRGTSSSSSPPPSRPSAVFQQQHPNLSSNPPPHPAGGEGGEEDTNSLPPFRYTNSPDPVHSSNPYTGGAGTPQNQHPYQQQPSSHNVDDNVYNNPPTSTEEYSPQLPALGNPPHSFGHHKSHPPLHDLPPHPSPLVATTPLILPHLQPDASKADQQHLCSLTIINNNLLNLNTNPSRREARSESIQIQHLANKPP
ncbi:collagen alpha-1(I) chain isoform X2 [Folsomia candida]|uniref:collagen alpha-1(I) chain isoform X2 n=1 Tax=Folsomia candida TaxID=158441 RepID=UPI000B9093D5|nr:collagen alpha-1(I) chain isoform X2 [Folsomia candida]